MAFVYHCSVRSALPYEELHRPCISVRKRGDSQCLIRRRRRQEKGDGMVRYGILDCILVYNILIILAMLIIDILFYLTSYWIIHYWHKREFCFPQSLSQSNESCRSSGFRCKCNT